MLFWPHENEINFDPAIRLRLPQTEPYEHLDTNAPKILSLQELHDDALAASTRAKLLRNLLGGCVVASAAGVAAIEGMARINIMPNTVTSGLIVGTALGLLTGEVCRQDFKSESDYQTAVRFAAYESFEAAYEETEPAGWSTNTLDMAGKTAEEVLRPSSSRYFS